MGSAVGKPAVENYETVRIPPPSSMDVATELARLLVEEKTGNGVGGQEIAAPGDGAGVDPDPETPNKGEKEPEKEVPTQFHKRPDCAFYMKTGTCKFGTSCRFNHPAGRTKPRVWKRDGENAQFSKNATGKHKEPPLKKVEQTEKKDDKVEKQTSSGRLEQEDCKFQKNDMGKQKGPTFKTVEQTEKKVDKVDLQTSSKRLEQEDSKIAEKMSNEAISGKTGIIECKFYTTPGGCKFGNSCKYAHFLKKIEVTPIVLNFLGLPIRPGKKECPYYMRTGNCKYTVNCKYHHPDPTIAIDEQCGLPDCQIIGSVQQTPNPAQGTFYVPTPLTVASPSYFPEPNLHPRVVPFHSRSEYNDYQIHTDEYSERPGFIKNKACKVKTTNKVHHPNHQ